MCDIREIEKNVSFLSNLLKVLSNEKRLMIVCALYSGEKSVGALEEVVGLSQSALSQHLARLRHDKIVDTRRSAQTIYYSLNDSATHRLLESLGEINLPAHAAVSSARLQAAG